MAKYSVSAEIGDARSVTAALGAAVVAPTVRVGSVGSSCQLRFRGVLPRPGATAGACSQHCVEHVAGIEPNRVRRGHAERIAVGVDGFAGGAGIQ